MLFLMSNVKVLLTDRVLGNRPGDLIEVDEKRAEHIVSHGWGEYVGALRQIEVADDGKDGAAPAGTESDAEPARGGVGGRSRTSAG